MNKKHISETKISDNVYDDIEIKLKNVKFYDERPIIKSIIFHYLTNKIYIITPPEEYPRHNPVKDYIDINYKDGIDYNKLYNNFKINYLFVSKYITIDIGFFRKLIISDLIKIAEYLNLSSDIHIHADLNNKTIRVSAHPAIFELLFYYLYKEFSNNAITGAISFHDSEEYRWKKHILEMQYNLICEYNDELIDFCKSHKTNKIDDINNINYKPTTGDDIAKTYSNYSFVFRLCRDNIGNLIFNEYGHVKIKVINCSEEFEVIDHFVNYISDINNLNDYDIVINADHSITYYMNLKLAREIIDTCIKMINIRTNNGKTICIYTSDSKTIIDDLKDLERIIRNK